MACMKNEKTKKMKKFLFLSIGHPGGNLWEIWGKLVNDWGSAKKKPAFVKVSESLVS